MQAENDDAREPGNSPLLHYALLGFKISGCVCITITLCRCGIRCFSHLYWVFKSRKLMYSFLLVKVSDSNLTSLRGFVQQKCESWTPFARVVYVVHAYTTWSLPIYDSTKKMLSKPNNEHFKCKSSEIRVAVPLKRFIFLTLPWEFLETWAWKIPT